jgi:hypothetical protein
MVLSCVCVMWAVAVPRPSTCTSTCARTRIRVEASGFFWQLRVYWSVHLTVDNLSVRIYCGTLSPLCTLLSTFYFVPHPLTLGLATMLATYW